MFKELKIWQLSFVLLLIAVLFFSFSGCSFLARKASEEAVEKAIEKETGKDTEVDLGEKSIKVKTKGGETELQTSGNLPKDFPEEFPLYEGAEIKGTLRTESEGKVHFQVTFETKDELSKVAEFFKEKLPKSGYKISSTVETQESALLYLSKGEESIGMVMITKEGDKTTFTVTITK